MKVCKFVIVVLAVGMFSVSAFGQPSNDCATAPVVAVPSSTAGDTLASATAYGPLWDCQHEYGGDGGFVVGGQWVQVQGTGNTMTASLCPGETVDNDNHLVVICNDCDDPMCVGASEDLCGSLGYSGEVEWCSIAGQTYWVGAGDNYAPQGAIQIDITDDGTPCATASSCGPPSCGNDIREGNEECDGTDIGSCVPGTICDGDCTCPDPICGNNITEEGEECDGTDDFACPGECVDCKCPEAVPALPIWGIVGLGVLLVGGGATAVARRRKKA